MKLAIVGMGISGQGAARLALAQGHDVSLLDSKTIRCSPKWCHSLLWLSLASSKAHLIALFYHKACHLTCLGFSRPDKPALDIDGELSVAAQQIHIPIIAITGTNGKSSTATTPTSFCCLPVNAVLSAATLAPHCPILFSDKSI